MSSDSNTANNSAMNDPTTDVDQPSPSLDLDAKLETCPSTKLHKEQFNKKVYGFIMNENGKFSQPRVEKKIYSSMLTQAAYLARVEVLRWLEVAPEKRPVRAPGEKLKKNTNMNIDTTRTTGGNNLWSNWKTVLMSCTTNSGK